MTAGGGTSLWAHNNQAWLNALGRFASMCRFDGSCMRDLGLLHFAPDAVDQSHELRNFYLSHVPEMHFRAGRFDLSR